MTQLGKCLEEEKKKNAKEDEYLHFTQKNMYEEMKILKQVKLDLELELSLEQSGYKKKVEHFEEHIRSLEKMGVEKQEIFNEILKQKEEIFKSSLNRMYLEKQELIRTIEDQQGLAVELEKGNIQYKYTIEDC